jgi:hypothetical protein
MNTAAMAAFRLLYQPIGGGTGIDRTLEAPSLDHAYRLAAEIVAAAHGMTGEHVEFDRASQQLTVGAGYRSRRGSFRLEPVSG